MAVGIFMLMWGSSESYVGKRFLIDLATLIHHYMSVVSVREQAITVTNTRGPTQIGCLTLPVHNINCEATSHDISALSQQYPRHEITFMCQSSL